MGSIACMDPILPSKCRNVSWPSPPTPIIDVSLLYGFWLISHNSTNFCSIWIKFYKRVKNRNKNMKALNAIINKLCTK